VFKCGRSQLRGGANTIDLFGIFYYYHNELYTKEFWCKMEVMKQTIVGLIVLFFLIASPVNAITLGVTETDEPLIEPTIVLSPTAGVTAVNDDDQDNLTIWFLGATIGLLLIIIVAQAWPKKDEES
jgi:hypothetical protein